MIIESGNSNWNPFSKAYDIVKPISVVIADRHSIFRAGLRALFEKVTDINVIAEAETGKQVLQMAPHDSPVVLLMDISLSQVSVFEIARTFPKTHPHLKMILLADHLEEREIGTFLSLNIKGFLDRRDTFQTMLKAIREVQKNKTFYGSFVSKHFNRIVNDSSINETVTKQQVRPITARQTEILELIASGNSNKQIGLVLGISVKTVEKHRQHLMNNLDIHETAGLVRYSLRTGVTTN